MCSFVHLLRRFSSRCSTYLFLPDICWAVEQRVGVGLLILSLVHIRSYFPPCSGRWVPGWTSGPPSVPYKVSHAPPLPPLLSPPCLQVTPQHCRRILEIHLRLAVLVATLSQLAIFPGAAACPAESCLAACPVALWLTAVCPRAASINSLICTQCTLTKPANLMQLVMIWPLSLHG